MHARWMIGVGIALGLTACSSSRLVQVPPKMDLTRFGTVGLIELSSTNVSDDLRQQANQEFLTTIQTAQPGVPVLELGDERRVLHGVNGESLDPATMRAIGEQHGVDVILFGVLEAKEVRPKVSFGSGFESLSAKAEVEGTLTAKMYDTRTGATLWTCSARDRKTMAGFSVSSGGLDGVGASHPDDTQDQLVHALVARATTDFRPGWVRMKE